MSEEAPALGPQIQSLRKARRLTLEQLATISGVSRSMLSQIERGQTNPTFATLWNLTRGLNVDISSLIGGEPARPHPQIEVIASYSVPEIKSEDGLCTLRILSPAQLVGRIEWYELILEPGATLASEPHARGSIEHVTVIEGMIEACAGDTKAVISTRGVGRYPADVRHELRNVDKGVTRAFLVVEA
jgi:XRE family transcriptional regulator, regulator of sulfur utilization